MNPLSIKTPDERPSVVLSAFPFPHLIKRRRGGALFAAISALALLVAACNAMDDGASPEDNENLVPNTNYAIRLNPGEIIFPSLDHGYAEKDLVPSTVTVSNRGIKATGPLTLEVTEEGGDSFTLDLGTIDSIPVGGSAAFTVVPKPGLGPGRHIAEVKVSGNRNMNSAYLALRLSVRTEYGIELDVSVTHSFSPQYQEYERLSPLDVEVSNTGSNPTGDLSVVLSGDNADSFTLGGDSFTPLEVGAEPGRRTIPGIEETDETASFTIVPNDGLDVGSYRATVTVSNDENKLSETFHVSFAVQMSAAGVKDYLAAATGGGTAANPVDLPVDLLKADDWATVLKEIGEAKKYVKLNVSGSDVVPGAGTAFDPGSDNTGEPYIVSLDLPKAAKSIKNSSSDSPLFKNFTSLKEVSGEDIATIGEYAFSGCTALTTPDFPNVTSLGNYAFSGCTALATVSFPRVATIVAYAFNGCSVLTGADFPLAKVIDGYAFNGCVKLETADFPNVTSIGPSAFYGCSKLTEADFPQVVSLGASAFYNCTTLATANFPKTTSIGAYAFYGCTTLATVAFPQVTSLGDYIFYNCSIFATMYFPKVTSTGNFTFRGTALTELNHTGFPALKTIGSDSFYSCTKLITVDLQNVTSLDAYAFQNCTNLATVNLPNITLIGPYTFYACKLATVSFPKVTSIGSQAFYSCTPLATVSFPKVTSIGTQAFSYTALTEVSSTNFPVLISISNSSNIFSSCTALTTVNLPNLTSIGSNSNSLFSNCTALTTVNLPDLTSISSSTFLNCTSLATVSFQNVTSIGDHAFRGCIALGTASFPNVTTIGFNAFVDNGGTTLTVTLPQSAPTLSALSGSATENTTTNYSKTVTINKTGSGTSSGYDTAWETNFKRRFGEKATVSLTIN